MFISTKKDFAILALEHGYSTSTYMSVLQFKINDLQEELIVPEVELLPGFKLRHVMYHETTRIRIMRNRRDPSVYTMSIWFAEYSNYAFRFKAKLRSEARSLQQVFYELALNPNDKRIHDAPQAKYKLSDFTTLQLLEEVEARYKTAVPNWAKLINDKNRPKELVKKIA